MNHEDFKQQHVTLDDGSKVWVTFCTCGKAFWGFSSQNAYDNWEQHESHY